MRPFERYAVVLFWVSWTLFFFGLGIPAPLVISIPLIFAWFFVQLADLAWLLWNFFRKKT